MDYHRIMIIRSRLMALVALADAAFRLEHQQSADQRAIPTPPCKCLRRYQLQRASAELIRYHLRVGVNVSSTYESPPRKLCCLFPNACDELLTYGIRQIELAVWRVRIHHENVLGRLHGTAFRLSNNHCHVVTIVVYNKTSEIDCSRLRIKQHSLRIPHHEV